MSTRRQQTHLRLLAIVVTGFPSTLIALGLFLGFTLEPVPLENAGLLRDLSMANALVLAFAFAFRPRLFNGVVERSAAKEELPLIVWFVTTVPFVGVACLAAFATILLGLGSSMTTDPIWLLNLLSAVPLWWLGGSAVVGPAAVLERIERKLEALARRRGAPTS